MANLSSSKSKTLHIIKNWLQIQYSKNILLVNQTSALKQLDIFLQLELNAELNFAVVMLTKIRCFVLLGTRKKIFFLIILSIL